MLKVRYATILCMWSSTIQCVRNYIDDILQVQEMELLQDYAMQGCELEGMGLFTSYWLHMKVNMEDRMALFSYCTFWAHISVTKDN
jgi:hypothetical protein